MPTPSAFATKLASIATDEFNKFHLINEGEQALCSQIKKWTQDIGFAFSSCTEVPWSAVFVSWCVQQAGATASEFKFAMAHSVFVNQAIKNALNGVGVFRGRRITEHPPGVGDIIHENRGNHHFDFDFASKNDHFISHSVIVVDVKPDQGFALCIGGNESDSVRRSKVFLDSQGLIKQRPGNPFICVIEDLK